MILTIIWMKVVDILDNVIPLEVQTDQWLLFHGSSNIYEDSISKNGLRPEQSQFEIEDLQKVESLYERLHWSGTHMGGFGVLKPYSIMHDYGHQKGKPLYLAESAQRASLYSTKDFAGGEICRALHYCLVDLSKYINEEYVREEHAIQLERQPEQYRVERSAIPKLKWVAHEVEKLSEIKNKVESIRNSYDYGLIYVLRLDVEKLSEIQGHRSMGIKSFRSISQVEVVDKYIFPASFQEPFGEDEKRFNAAFEPGIVKTIMERSGL
jgi:hypothetical protein